MARIIIKDLVEQANNTRRNGQRKQTDDEIYRTLLEDFEAVKDLPQGRGDNLELDEDDERVLNELYPSDEQAAED